MSSAAYTALTAWAATTAYTVGQIRRPTAPAYNTSHVYRCTTAGTSGGTEPTWSTALDNNSTKVDGGVTWTNVTGQSAYGWGAAAGTLFTLAGGTGAGTGRNLAGDRVFLSSDHSETLTTGGNATYPTSANTHAFGLVQHISVNRAGSVPPVAADVLAGASIISSNTQLLVLEAYCDVFWQGITFSQTSTAHIYFNSGALKSHYFKNCEIGLNSANSTLRMCCNNPSKLIFDNTKLRFGHVGQGFGGLGYSFELFWFNTPAALAGATFPTILFSPALTPTTITIVCRGIDLSSVTGTIVGTSPGCSKILLDSCKISAAVTRLETTLTNKGNNDEVELINCFDGTNTLNERYSYAGAVTTDRSTTLTGGAQDDIGLYSLKMVASARADKYVIPLDGFWLDVENTAIGSAKTATVEIISSASLNNDEISLLLEYMGTSGSSVASFLTTLPAVLSTAAAVTTSTVTWNSPPATPVKQKLSVSFTPQVAGRLRGLVRLGKVSTTVWINPQIAIT